MRSANVLDPLARLVENRTVLVVGAAPLTQPLREPADVVIAVNGGISSTAGFAGARCACPRPYRPLVWLLNSRSNPYAAIDTDARRLADLMIRQGAQRRVDLAVFLARDELSPMVTLQAFARQGTAVGAWLALGPDTRSAVEYASGARSGDMTPKAISAGVTAAGLAFVAGAAQVRLDGFSWTPGYAYAPAVSVPKRGHTRGDTLALQALGARYGTRLEHPLRLSH